MPCILDNVLNGRFATVETMSSGLREVRCVRITADEFHWLGSDGRPLYRGRRVSWNVQQATSQILADPALCAVRFMRRTRRCFRCGRHLEAQDSIDRASGPRCWAKILQDWEQGPLDELVRLWALPIIDDLSTVDPVGVA